MSEDQIRAFLAAVEADIALQERLEAALDVDAVVAIAKEAGFVVSADELKQSWGWQEEESLSEVELELVAAGALQGQIGSNHTRPCCPHCSTFLTLCKSCTYSMLTINNPSQVNGLSPSLKSF
jgi:predicted ribosomally synthesized peptide with nif11-like leader